ncbi:MAG: hypothetical protein IT565_14035, partial [Rhodospirillales bacterium]|nr:hypothetical protein [Rhodospirillales bacterium]
KAKKTKNGNQQAVDTAIALERAHQQVGTAMQVRAAERAGQERVARIKDRMSAQAKKAREEMATERRESKARATYALDSLRTRALNEGYRQAEAAGNAGAKSARDQFRAFAKEAASIVMKNLPRWERGRSTIVRAIRDARTPADIQRLITEVQHRAVSARAGESWKSIRKLTRGRRLSKLPESSTDVANVPDGTNLRAEVKTQLEKARALVEQARNQRASPVRLAKMLNELNALRDRAKNTVLTPEERGATKTRIMELKQKIRDIRPDIADKVTAAAELDTLRRSISETFHAARHADNVYMAGERKSARYVRRNIEGRVANAPKLAREGASTTPELEQGPAGKVIARVAFENFTPDSMGQWLDNAMGSPEQAEHAHLVLFREPMKAYARIAEEQVQRLADFNALAEKHGFRDFEEAEAMISGTAGGALQETVRISVPGWHERSITMGEALTILGDTQDVQTVALSDQGMRHRILRTSGKETPLPKAVRDAVIDSIPPRFREFYTELKALKERSIGKRSLEIRRRIKGSAPDAIPGREPRLREQDSDYTSDVTGRTQETRSLLEQSFLKDRTHTAGPTRLVVDGLQAHIQDWDNQLRVIHLAPLAETIGKTILHKDVLNAVAHRAGAGAKDRLKTMAERVLAKETGNRLPKVVDKIIRTLRSNVGAAFTAISPITFAKQFSAMPLLAALHPKEAMRAAGKMASKGLTERMMKANGLLAQRLNMNDAAIAASAGSIDPLIDAASAKLRLRSAGRGVINAAKYASQGRLLNATASAAEAGANAIRGTTGLFKLNAWADKQGTKLAFLISEQLVDAEQPRLSGKEREQVIGERAAELVYRTMNTYDIMGQSLWRSELDQNAAMGLLNMFSNDGTKHVNLLLQAAMTGDRGPKARHAAAGALAGVFSATAASVIREGGRALWAAMSGTSQT